MPWINLKKAHRVAYGVLSNLGVSDEDIDIIWDTMKYADVSGKTTHGLGRLPLYQRNIEAGTLNPTARTEVVIDDRAAGILNANDGFGQVAAVKAINFAMEKARDHGVGAVGVRNSNNFGTAGYFGTRCAEKGYIALIFANSAPAIAPSGGTEPLFGTNPLCFAAPGTSNHPSIVFDMAVTTAARSKIRLALKNGETIPDGWAIDSHGNPTIDPAAALEGLLQPIGGYKGCGLAMMVDILAGLITKSEFAGGVKPLSDLGRPSRSGHLFIALDPYVFLSQSEYEHRATFLFERMHESGPGVHIPGESVSASSRDSIHLSEKQASDIDALARKMGISSLI